VGPVEGADQDPWTPLFRWRSTKQLEVFLNGDPPQCLVPYSQWTRLHGLTAAPRMSLEHMGDTVADEGDVDGNEVDSVDDPSARIAEAHLVFTARDVASHVSDFQPASDEAKSEIKFWPHFQPTAFDEAFLPGKQEFVVRYKYTDADRLLCINSLFVQRRHDRAAHEWIEQTRTRIRGMVKSDLMGTFDLSKFKVAARPDLWQWGEASESFAIEVNEKYIGNVFMAKARSSIIYCLIAGFPLETPESIRVVLRPFLNRIEHFLKGFYMASPGNRTR
jgi:hypothetical protein